MTEENIQQKKDRQIKRINSVKPVINDAIICATCGLGAKHPTNTNIDVIVVTNTITIAIYNRKLIKTG